MSKKAKIFSICLTLMFLCLSSFLSPSSGKEGIGLKVTGEAMSAELQGVSLRLILERLEEEKGIWFKGDESALDESISIRFEDLPLHEGLKRILSNINHVLVFDQERGLVGLFILGKKDAGRRAPGEEATVSRNPFELFPGADHTGNAKTRSMDRTIGRDSSPLEDRDTQIDDKDKPFTDLSSGPESPFGENAAPSSEGPFDKGITPSSRDPFADSFGAFPESQGGRR